MNNTKEQLDPTPNQKGPFFLLLMSILTVFSCQSDQFTDLEGVWVGGGLQVDQTDYAPILTVLKIENEKATGINVVYLDTFDFSISLDSIGLHVDTSTYALQDVKLEKDQFKYRSAYPINYWRSSSRRPDISRLSLRSELIGTTWEWDDYTLTFTSEQKVNVSYHDKEYSGEHCWYLKDVYDLCMMTILGNFKDCDGLQFPLIQILDYTEDRMKVLWSKDGQRTSSVWQKLHPADPIELSEFQVCDPHLSLKTPGAMYYHRGTRLEGGHYAIWKEIETRKDLLDFSDYNGLVRVRFVVNCVGLTGRFEVDAFNDDYELTTTPSAIRDQLVELTRILRAMEGGTTPIYRRKDG